MRMAEQNPHAKPSADHLPDQMCLLRRLTSTFLTGCVSVTGIFLPTHKKKQTSLCSACGAPLCRHALLSGATCPIPVPFELIATARHYTARLLLKGSQHMALPSWQPGTRLCLTVDSWPLAHLCLTVDSWPLRMAALRGSLVWRQWGG